MLYGAEWMKVSRRELNNGRSRERRFTRIWAKAPQIDDDTKFICSKMSCEIYLLARSMVRAPNGLEHQIKHRNENKWFIPPKFDPSCFLISCRIIKKMCIFIHAKKFGHLLSLSLILPRFNIMFSQWVLLYSRFGSLLAHTSQHINELFIEGRRKLFN